MLPGLLLAGEYPGAPTRTRAQERLQRLLAAGIQCFIDLTHPEEMDPYEGELPSTVRYFRMPIVDHGLPGDGQMREILDCLQSALAENRPTYVHCRAGIGRTGTVIGCLLVERGVPGDIALAELNQLWKQSERSKSWPTVPETDGQTDFIRAWRPALPVSPSSVATQAQLDPLLEQSTLEVVRGLRERFMGALVGLAVGDAVAAATQYRRAGSFTAVGDLLGGGPFDLPRGGWSDDTAMALCLAESLLEMDGFDARDQVRRYQRWQQEGHLSSTGQCVGITASTARALALAQWRRQLFPGSHDPRQLDPEPLSRLAPAVMYFFSSNEEALQHAADSARITCQAPPVLDSCRLLARALHRSLSGQSKDSILADFPGWDTQPSRANGTAAEALSTAIWAFGSTTSFRDAVLAAANVGGNSDVVTAVCGQIAGAHYTVTAIPPSWRNGLILKDVIEDFADKLLTRALVALGN